jgi:hypothetical protein
MLLPQDTNVPGAPPSYGYAVITNTGSMIALGGALSDGAPFSRVEPISEANSFPLYASLYNYTGLLLGQLSLDTAAFGAVPSGELAWFKPPSRAGFYSNGFNTLLAVQGAPWTNSASALSAFTNQAQLTFYGGGLASNLDLTVQLTSSGALRLLGGPATFAGGFVNRANGLLTLAFTNAAGSKVTGYGTILQNTNLGGGFFPGATNTGTFKLQP